MNAQSGHDPTPVEFDCLDGDAEDVRDFLVLPPVYNQLEDLTLSRL
jgi:hypothetical protein